MSESDAERRRLLSSLHTHSHFCDGHGEIEEYARAAVAAGLGAFGASGHAPLPFECDYAMPLGSLDAYRADVRRVVAEFGDRIPVFLGIELDYLPGLGDFYRREFLERGFDYFVASVHYVAGTGIEPWAYDESEVAFAQQIVMSYGGDVRPVVQDYYRRIAEMVEEVAEWGVPCFVGHLDRITLWNRDERYFPTGDEWYGNLVDEALATIARHGLPVELNTSGWDKPVATPNPDRAILRRCAKLGIPAILSADAHRPAEVDRHFDEGLRLLQEAGITELVVPRRDGWRRVSIESSWVDRATATGE